MVVRAGQTRVGNLWQLGRSDVCRECVAFSAD